MFTDIFLRAADRAALEAALVNAGVPVAPDLSMPRDGEDWALADNNGEGLPMAGETDFFAALRLWGTPAAERAAALSGMIEQMPETPPIVWAGGMVDTPPPIVSDMRVIASYAFVQRFTAGEQAAIQAAALVNASIALWLTKVTAAVEIDLDAQDTIDGMDALLAALLITAQRRDTILA